MPRRDGNSAAVREEPLAEFPLVENSETSSGEMASTIGLTSYSSSLPRNWPPLMNMPFSQGVHHSSRT
ncbi:MAG: hypothetical protein ACI93T_003559, partial [Porticoccaceae bacterium]